MKNNECVLKRYEILRELSDVPIDRLQEIDTFIKFILSQGRTRAGNKKREPRTLAGIWKGKGFEKITNLDEEITKLRQELGEQILERHK